LRGVSVGFAPFESEPLHKERGSSGRRYKRQALLECSLVSVPANPNALALAKSLHISDATKRLVFYGKPADKASSLTKTQQDTLKVIDKINRQIKAVKLPADQLAYLMRSRRILIDRFINPVPVTSHDERQQATLRSINRCHKLRKSSELSPSQRQTLEKAYETLTNLYVERQKKWAARTHGCDDREGR
jgi:hypothetical protein